MKDEEEALLRPPREEEREKEEKGKEGVCALMPAELSWWGQDKGVGEKTKANKQA